MISKLSIVISKVNKTQVDSLFNHLKVVDPQIRITMQSPGNDGNIPFLDTKRLHSKDNSIQLLSGRPDNILYMYMVLNVGTMYCDMELWSVNNICPFHITS